MNEESRVACYILLAQGLAYPHDAFPDELRQLVDVLSASEDAHPLANELVDLSAGLEDAAGLSLDVLQGEHTGLFVNNLPHVPCPPYESAYRENTLVGEATASVSRTYREWGLEVQDEFADYAGAELEFMAFAIRLSSEDADTETIPTQQAFLRDHLLSWMPKFALDIQNAAKLSMYHSLGRLLALFLSLENEALLAETPEGRAGAPRLRLEH